METSEQEQMKGNTSFESEKTIINNGNRKYQLNLNMENLNLEFAKRLVNKKDVTILNFVGNPETTNEDFKKLSEIIESQKKLKELNISCRGNYEIFPEVGVYALGKSIKKLTSLKSLSLKFAEYSNLDNAGLMHLSQGFQRLTSLEKISLCLPSNPINSFKYIDDQGLLSLGKSFKQLYSLKNIQMNLSGQCSSIRCTCAGDKGIIGLVSCLRKLPEVQILDLDFSGKDENFTNFGVIGISEIIKGMKSLENLQLNFAECYGIDDDGLVTMSAELGNLVNLKSLTLNLREPRIIYRTGLGSIGYFLSKMTLLKSLNLDFSHCDGMIDRDFYGITKVIKNLASLETLVFNFGECIGITDSAIQEMSQDLSGLVSLQNFKASFDGCNKITTEGLNQLTMGMKSLVYLKSLDLAFTFCPKIADVGVQNLIESLKNMQSLKELSLDFTGLINEKRMLEEIGKLESLEKIKLFGFYVKEFANGDLIHLIQLLASMRSMKDIFLSVKGCKNVTNGVFASLSEQIPKLPTLPNLTLLLGSCYDLTRDSMTRCTENLKTAFPQQKIEIILE